MREPEEVAAMLALHAKGWGAKRIARKFGVSRNTVKRYLAAGGWVAYRRAERGSRLAGLEVWLKERFRRHRGNAEVIRQELLAEKRIEVSLRTVERAVAPWRHELAAEARATVRFETAPGEQLQIDFGEKRVVIGAGVVRVHLFVATLGYSRRNFVMAFDNQRQGSWLQGIEAAFAHFGGVSVRLLLDYVFRHIIRLLCRSALCGGHRPPRATRGRHACGRTHNRQSDSSHFSRSGSRRQTLFRGDCPASGSGGVQSAMAASFMRMLTSA
jgi:transposase